MWRCWRENVGGRATRLCLLLVIVSLSLLLAIMTLPRLSLAPRHIVQPTAGYPAPSVSSDGFSPAVPRVGSIHWDRVAAFYVLTGRKDDHYISALLAETAEDCQSLPTNTTSSICGRAVDIYVLYSNDDELRAGQAAVNTTRYSPGVSIRHIYRRINPQNAVREVNDVMLDAYLDGVNYFRLVLTNGTSGTSLDTAHRLDELPVRRHGVIVEMSSSSATLAAILFGCRHFDVFGWFLPLSSATLESASQTVCDVYTSRDMARVLRGGSDVTDVVRWNTSIGEHLVTLDRYMSALRNSSCWRCVSRDHELKVISMSLYGSDKRYTVGAIRNAQLLPVVYPGWRLWVHCERPEFNSATSVATCKYPAVPDGVLRRLNELGADLRPVNRTMADTIAPMLWRFRVAADLRVSVFIVRDADSRLTPRDVAVVSDWLQHPDAYFHCIRDHPSHSNFAVSGGLWGGRPSQLAAFDSQIRQLFEDVLGKYGAGYLEDMYFLGTVVWPRIQRHAYCHDSFSCEQYPSSHAFPVARVGSEHLGEVYDEWSVGRQGDIDILLKKPVNSKCVP